MGAPGVEVLGLMHKLWDAGSYPGDGGRRIKFQGQP
jgi:hypothetical protein